MCEWQFYAWACISTHDSCAHKFNAELAEGNLTDRQSSSESLLFSSEGVVCVQNWKTQRPARNEIALMFGEAAALPCVLEEQVQIARLLTAYDRWLVSFARQPYSCLGAAVLFDL